MANTNRVYIARKSCGCIVAAFPVVMDKAVKGELLKQLAKAGYDIEQATDLDVRMDFALTCDHNKPPLLAYMDSRTKEGALGAAIAKEDLGIDTEEGIDRADVEAAGTDLEPEAEETEAQIAAEETAQETKAEEKSVDHQAEADSLLNNFLEKKDGEEEDDEEADAD